MRDIAPSTLILDWYDRHARDLPWRVGPAARAGGVRPDPYRVWLSEIMLQQTTVAAVRDYFTRFTTLWPTVMDLAAAHDPDVMGAWAGLGYYARARNLLKCARVIAGDHDGVFPRDHDMLLTLPGIGPYTAAAIAAIAFDRPETVVDGNVERVMARLHAEPTPLPRAKPVLTSYARALTPPTRPGDYAQAVMDLGATICTPRNPACGICPWSDLCTARQQGIQGELPKKEPKSPKPIRFGTVYLARRPDGAWLLERRPESGLLGGMLGWPGSGWAEAKPEATPPFPADWRELPDEVRHTFTHFHLRLTVLTAQPGDIPAPEGLFWQPSAAFRASDLPTVMRKAHKLGQSTFAEGDPQGIS